MKKLHTSLIFILSIIPLALSASVEIKTHLIPEQLSVNQRGVYKITLTGESANAHLELPHVEGLEQTGISKEVNYSYINGTSSQEISYIFSITPKASGVYTLPSFTINIKNKQYTVPASTLTVTEKAPSSSPAPNPSHTEAELQVIIDKTKVLLGEMVPVKVTLVVPLKNNILEVAQRPHKESDAFLDNDFPNKPTESSGTLHGKPAHTITWQTYVTPTKTGEQSLQYKIQVAVSAPYIEPYSPIEVLMKQAIGSILRDRVTAVAREIVSPKLNLSVDPLPPPPDSTDFSGAIGNFKLETASINPESASIGDPIVLQCTLSGSGNFERLTPPPLGNIPGWKIYPPKVSFTPSDTSGFTGKKTFEYILIPQNDSLTQTPPLSFTVFDTEQASFKDISIPPLPITLTPSQATLSMPPPSIAVSEPIHSSNNGTGPPLFYQTTIQSLKSIFSTPWIYAFSAVPIILITSFYIAKKHKRQKKLDTPENRQRIFDLTIQSHLHNLRTAYSKKNPERFYNSFQKTISTIASKDSSQVHHSLTFPEIEKLLSSKNVSSPTLKKLQEFYHTIDLIKFGGYTYQPLTRKDFQEADLLIKDLLNRS